MSALSDRRGHFGKDYLSCLGISRGVLALAMKLRVYSIGHERPLARTPKQSGPGEMIKLKRPYD
jgi:hypothetical protein